jgi:hypothetical protein
MLQMKSFITVLIALAFCYTAAAQAPNGGNFTPFSPTTAQTSKLSTVPVNIFTGVPIVSVPLYSYQSPSGALGYNLSLSYFAGGTQVSQAATTVGLGWYLNAAGAVTRTVRGMPDDFASGFLYTGAIPTDFRAGGNNYYDDYTDAQQDIFEFNCNGRTGKFLIGKDKAIILTEMSKLKISYTLATDNTIASFRIVNESGVKYDFATKETTKITGLTDFVSGYSNADYTSAWNLTQIISPFNTDTIKFNYNSKTISSVFAYPQTTYVKNADGTRPYTYAPLGSVSSNTNTISAVVLPDGKKISFIYGTINLWGSLNDTALVKIKFSDTALRTGYLFNYANSTIQVGGAGPVRTSLFLKKVTPFTAKGIKRGYSFNYTSPLAIEDYNIAYQKDYWGFYNKATLPNPPNLFPLINGYTWGTSRNPDITYTTANALTDYYLPDGGYINYQYELNSHYPYIKSAVNVAVNAAAASQNNITLNKVYNNKHLLSFNLSALVSRVGSAPITGDGSITCSIKNTAGTVTYASTVFSLYDLFYLGIKTWQFNLPNGSYQLQTQLSAGTVVTGSFPVNVTWENQLPDNSSTAVAAGGLRVKKITRRAVSDDVTNATIEEYKYITEDGKSSGFLGDIPKYDYPYQETVTNGGTTTTTDYTAVSSEPVNNQDYSQGSPVGYSRVEVISGTANHNIGKTVYEFTGLQDVNSNAGTSAFPYAPQQLNDWGWGLPKKVYVYDSAGVLVKKTITNYTFDTVFYTSPVHRSLKLGKSATSYTGGNLTGKTYIAQEYYPSAGRAYPVTVLDTIFQKNGSINTSYKNLLYDTNYNVKKVITNYDKTRNLQLETRMYYPYDYFFTKFGAIKTLKTEGIISPVVATESWITGDANPRLISASVSDFQIINGYIKPRIVYELQNNKPVPLSVIGNFDSSKLVRDTNYIKAQQVFTTFDIKGNLLETKSAITNQASSVITDYNNQYAIAKIANAGYFDAAYTSFEADGTGNWAIASTLRDSTAAAVTGRRSYNLTNGNITTANVLNTATAYLVTVWANTGTSVYVNGIFLATPIAQQNGWGLYTIEITAAPTITVSGTGLIDELRLHPKDAYMSTATYEPMVGITSANDAGNQITYYEYDYMNRTSVIRDKNKNIIKKYEYSDGNAANTTQPVNFTPNWIVAGTVWYTGCTYDNVYRDDNPYSDSFNITKTVPQGLNYCLCPYPYNTNVPPQYKTVNGTCEAGERINTSTVRIKLIDANNNVTWVWRCTYHYLWSDGSVSIDYTQDNASPCALGGGA